MRSVSNNRTGFTAAAAIAALLILPAVAPAQTKETTTMEKDIVQIAAENGSFKTLVAAVRAAGLEATLQGGGPFTVFAPTDAAFAKLPAGMVESLLEDKAKLTAILTYHVLPARVQSADVTGAAEPATVNGEVVRVERRDGAVFVNDARVIQADIRASNGIIHVIDAVLLPAAQPAAR
jgi:uncharacterized surface protein with fasciclin (FAS1) repeats